MVADGTVVRHDGRLLLDDRLDLDGPLLRIVVVHLLDCRAQKSADKEFWVYEMPDEMPFWRREVVCCAVLDCLLGESSVEGR